MENRPIKALVLYWSATGNTKKVAETIQVRLEKERVNSKIVKLIEDNLGNDKAMLGEISRFLTDVKKAIKNKNP